MVDQYARWSAASLNVLTKAWPPKEAQKSRHEDEILSALELEEEGRNVAQQEPRWTSKSAEEIAAFPGVLALSKRFEVGQLSEGNVAKLAQAFTPTLNTR